MATPIITSASSEGDALTVDDQAALDAEQQGAEPAQQEREEAAPAGEERAQKPRKQSETVPFDRFREANESAKAATKEAAELRERWARLEERAQMAREADQRMREAQQAAQGPQRPDETTDPLGAQLWDRDQRIQRLEQQNQEIRQGLGQTAQQVQQTAQFNEFANRLNADVQNYARTTKPDYFQAAQFAENRMIEWAQSLGAPEQEARNIVAQLSSWAATRAYANGQSAAEGFYRLSEAMGYAPGSGGAATQQRQQPSQAQQRAQTTLDQARKVQQFQGLSRVPKEDDDNVNWTTMSAKDIAEYDEDQFAQDMNDPRKKQQWMKLFERLEMGSQA